MFGGAEGSEEESVMLPVDSAFMTHSIKRITHSPGERLLPVMIS